MSRKILFLSQSLPESINDAIVSGAVKNPFYLLGELLCRYEVIMVSFDKNKIQNYIKYDGDKFYVKRFSASFLKLFLRIFFLNFVSLFYILRVSKNIDIIQSHHPHFALQVALLKKLGVLKAPLLIKAHGTAVPELQANSYTGFKGVILKINAFILLASDRFVLSQSDLVLTSSEFQRREMVSLYKVPYEKTRLIYNGFFSDIYDSLALPLDRNRKLLFVGRVVRKKQACYFIKMVDKLKEKNLDIEGKLVLGKLSEIEDRSYYDEIKENLANKNYFNVLFDLCERDLVNVYKSCCILVVPSIGYESIPTVIYEAHAAGLLVFATYKWGVPEILHADFALSGNLEDDVEKLNKYLQKNKLVEDIPSSQKYKSEDLQWKNLIKEYLKIYDELEKR